MDEVAFLPALEQARLLRERELRAVELAETYLGRIERLDPLLNAFVTVTAERALDDARRADGLLAGAGELPPFLGVPLSVKDLTSTAGVPIALWERVDVLLTPTLALPPVPVGWHSEPADPWTQWRRGAEFTPFTPIVNVTGQPAASLPLTWSAEGLPIGVQLVGPPAGDALLLRLCAQVEEARPWAGRRPPVS